MWAAATGALASQAAAGDRVVVQSVASLGAATQSWTPEARERYVPTIPTELRSVTERAFGERFAGLYYARPRGKDPVLVLRLVDPADSDRALVEAALQRKELKFITSRVLIAPAQFSASDLARSQRRLSSAFGSSASAVGIDEAANKVVVVLADPTRAEGAERAAKPARASLSLVVKARVPQSAVKWRSAPRPKVLAYPSGAYGGTRIWFRQSNMGCTTAFALDTAFGRFMSTAGHCGATNETVNSSLGPDGPVTATSLGKFTGRILGPTGDIGIFNTWAYGRQYVNFGDTWWVQGAEDPRVNEYVCFSGATTGSLSCGYVTKVNTTVTTNIGKIGRQFCTNITARSGDSGAPIFTVASDANRNHLVRARGILSSGGTGLACGTMWSQIAASYNAAIVAEAPACC